MTFANPMLLWGALAAGGPVLIHLVGKSRPRRIEWAAMRFLRTALEKRQRRARWEERLLLALRTLLILTLAAALARPMAGAWAAAGRGVPKDLYLLLDVTGSMADTSAGKAVDFELAKAEADRILRELPRGSRAAIWTSADDVRKIIPELTADIEAARSSVRGLAVTGRGGQLGIAAREALTEAARPGHTAAAVVVALTDGRGDSVKDVPGQVEVIRVGKAISRHLGIADVRQAGAALAGQAMRFDVEVHNYGVAAQAQGLAADQPVEVQLKMAGGTQLATAKTPAIAPGASATVSLSATFPPGKTEITFELPADSAPGDDVRAWVVTAAKELNVLIVDGSASEPGTKQQSFFLRRALATTLKATVISQAEFANADLTAVDAVVLDGIDDLSPAEIALFQQFAAKGGGLVLIPGQHVLSTAIAAALNIPLRLEGPKDAALRFDVAKLSHPLAAPWSQTGGKGLDAAVISRFIPIACLSDQAEPALIMEDAVGTKWPGVITGKWGAANTARAVIFAMGLTTDWGNLPLKPGVFVPLVNSAISRSARGSESADRIWAGQGWHGEVEGTPVVIEPSRTDHPGFAEIRGSGGKVMGHIAVWQPSAESRVDVPLSGTEAKAAETSVVKDGHEIWPALLGLSGLLSIAELAIASNSKASSAFRRSRS